MILCNLNLSCNAQTCLKRKWQELHKCCYWINWKSHKIVHSLQTGAQFKNHIHNTLLKWLYYLRVSSAGMESCLQWEIQSSINSSITVCTCKWPKICNKSSCYRNISNLCDQTSIKILTKIQLAIKLTKMQVCIMSNYKNKDNIKSCKPSGMFKPSFFISAPRG
jgi:hypothetical protein